MRITQIKLTNIGLHHSLTFDSDAPIVGILGKNGAGKSTLLDCISIALTGEAEDTLESYVSWGAGKGTIELDFVTEQPGKIVRELGRTSKRSLQWDGRTYTKAKEVDELMRDILRADKASVRSAIFIKQGSLQNMLFSKQSAKEDLFIDLVNLSYMSKRIGIVDGKIKKLQTQVADLTPQRQALETQVAEAQASLAAREAELAAMLDHAATIDTTVNVMADLTELQQLAAQINTLLPERNRLQNELSGFKCSNLSTVASRCDSLLQTYQTSQTRLQTLQRGITELQMRRGVEERIAKTKAHIAELQGTIANLDEKELRSVIADCRDKLFKHNRLQEVLAEEAKQQPVLDMTGMLLKGQPKPAFDQAALQARSHALGAEAFELRQLEQWLNFRQNIKGCIDKSTGECPECGLKVSNPEDVNEDEIAKLAETLKQKKGRHNLATISLAGDEKILTAYETRRSQLTSKLQSLSAELAKIKAEKKTLIGFADLNVEVITALESASSNDLVKLQASRIALNNATATKAKDEAELAKFTRILNPEEYNDDVFRAAKNLSDAAFETYNNELAIKDRLVKTLSDLENVTGRQTALQVRSDELNNKLTDIEYTMDELTLNLATMRHAQELRWQKKGEVEQANSAIGVAQRALALLMERIRQDEKVTDLIQQLQGIKTILSDLPTQYVNYKFAQIAEVTQRYLAELTNDFAVSIDPDEALSFQFVRCDEEKFYNLPQSKLSGGQRVRLSLAFLLAVQEILVPEVGLLVLDEPTLSLDEEGVESLAQFLIELNERIANTNLQVLIVDHHPALTSCFRKCLTL